MEKRRTLIVAAAFLILLATGLSTFRDYGVYLDEMANRSVYYFPDDFKTNAVVRELTLTHGVFFETFLRQIDKIMALCGLGDARPVLLARHLVVFLTFCGTALALFALGVRIFRNWKTALLGPLFLTLIPQVYGDAFVNNIDIPFLCFYTSATYTLLVFLDCPDLPRTVIHAVATALALGVRLAGGVVALATVMFFIHTWRTERVPGGRAYSACCLAIYLSLTSLILFSVWPALFTESVQGLMSAIYLSTYPQGDATSVVGIADPMYIPVCILVATPPLFSLLFAVGLVAALRHIVRPMSGLRVRRRDVAILLFLVLVPVGLSILARTRQYGLMRHFYFLYPDIILVVVFGLVSLWRALRTCRTDVVRVLLSASLVVVVAVSIIQSIVVLWQTHTVEIVYRSGIADALNLPDTVGRETQSFAERKALEAIAANDRHRHIGVVGAITYPLKGLRMRLLQSGLALVAADRDRLVPAKASRARYAISGDREPASNGTCRVSTSQGVLKQVPVQEELYTLFVYDRRIITVYRLR